MPACVVVRMALRIAFPEGGKGVGGRGHTSEARVVDPCSRGIGYRGKIRDWRAVLGLCVTTCLTFCVNFYESLLRRFLREL